MLLLFSSSPPPNFYGSPRRKVYIKSPAKTRLIDQGLYDYCRSTLRAPGNSVVYDLCIIYNMIARGIRQTISGSPVVYNMCVHTEWCNTYIARSYAIVNYIADERFVTAAKAFRHRKNTKRHDNKYDRRWTSGPRHATAATVVKRREDEIASGSKRFSEMPCGESDAVNKMLL